MPYAAVAGMALLAGVGAWLFAGTLLAVVAPVMLRGLLAFNMLYIREPNESLLRRERAPSYLIERLERAVAAAHAPEIRAPAARDR